MSKIKNGGLDQYGAEPLKQQQFGTAGVERVNDGLAGVQGGGAAFDIDRSSGVITLSRSLDREETSSFELTVTAHNDGFADTTTSVAVVVSVEDDNDNSPVVHFPTTADRLLVQLAPQTSIGALVTRIDANDADTGWLFIHSFIHSFIIYYACSST